MNFNSIGVNKFYKSDIDINVVDFVTKDRCSFFYREHIFYDEYGMPEIVEPLIPTDRNTYTKYSRELKKDLDIFVYKA